MTTANPAIRKTKGVWVYRNSGKPVNGGLRPTTSRRRSYRSRNRTRSFRRYY